MSVIFSEIKSECHYGSFNIAKSLITKRQIFIVHYMLELVISVSRRHKNWVLFFSNSLFYIFKQVMFSVILNLYYIDACVKYWQRAVQVMYCLLLFMFTPS